MYVLKQGQSAYWTGDHWADSQRLAKRFLREDQLTASTLALYFDGDVRFVRLRPRVLLDR